MTALPPPPQQTVDAIYAAIEEVEARRPRYQGYGISASTLGSTCDRQLWLSLRWASAPEVLTAKKIRVFARGNAAESRILGDLRVAGIQVEDVDPVARKQWSFALANGWLRGKADGILTGVVEAPKARHVVEIKCLKAAYWRGIQKHGLRAHKPEHWHQLHTGMVGLGIDRGLYIAENADTGELLTERLHLDHEEAMRQEARVMRAVEDHDPPLGMLGEATTEIKTQKIRNAPPCLFCDHKGICFDKAFALRSCRTCIHWTFGDGPNGHCARFDEPRTPAQQQAGKDCPAHLYLPALVPGQQTDADAEAETITYQMPDGSEWIDGIPEPEFEPAGPTLDDINIY